MSDVVRKHLAQQREGADKVRKELSSPEAGIYKTWGVRNAYLLETYLTQYGSPEEALRAFASDRKLSVGLEKECPATFNRLRSSIDNGSPVLLRSGAESFLCVGWVTNDGEQLLVVYRPEQGEYDTLTGNNTVHPKDLASEDPRVKSIVGSMKKMVVHRDKVLTAAPGMPPGVDIIAFDGPDLDAVYTGPWGATVDGIAAEIRRELGISAPTAE